MVSVQDGILLCRVRRASSSARSSASSLGSRSSRASELRSVSRLSACSRVLPRPPRRRRRRGRPSPLPSPRDSSLDASWSSRVFDGASSSNISTSTGASSKRSRSSSMRSFGGAIPAPKPEGLDEDLGSAGVLVSDGGDGARDAWVRSGLDSRVGVRREGARSELDPLRTSSVDSCARRGGRRWERRSGADAVSSFAGGSERRFGSRGVSRRERSGSRSSDSSDREAWMGRSSGAGSGVVLSSPPHKLGFFFETGAGGVEGFAERARPASVLGCERGVGGAGAASGSTEAASES